MTYSVTDIAELIRHHLVFSRARRSASDRESPPADRQISRMTPGPCRPPPSGCFCDRCGASVDVDVLAVDGSNFTPDGGFYCSGCLGDEEA